MADFTQFPISTKEFDPAQFAGADGADGTDGREVELQTNATHVQWRYVGEATWNDLILLSELEGPQGPQGVPGENGADGTDGIQPSGSTIINVRETTQSVTSGTVDANAGGIVTMTLSANATLNISNLSDGQSITIHIIGGDTYSMDWETNHTISWHGEAPTLGATHTVAFEQVGSTMYGYDVGSVG